MMPQGKPSQLAISPSRIALIALHAGYSHSSLALASIAANCELDGVEIRCFEELIKAKPESIVAPVYEYRPQIIGLSTYLWNIETSLRLARLLKQLLPDSAMVLGGPEAGPRAVELLGSEPAVDYIIHGDGEPSFAELVAQLTSGNPVLEKVPGLNWRDAGGARKTNGISVADLDKTVSPFASGHARTDKNLIYFETSRGCPFQCSFCTSGEESLRTYSQARIESDLQQIDMSQNKTVKVLDRSFHLGSKRTLQLLELFIKTKPGIKFHLELNPDRISDEALALFASAPPDKFQFEIGLQSLNPVTLENIHRQMDIGVALKKIQTLMDNNRHQVHLDLIVGLPGESADSCSDSLNRTFKTAPHHLQLGTLKLLPGTLLHREAANWGYRWDRSPPYEILAHDNLDYEDLLRFKRYAILLERLWNSKLLVHCMTHLVSSHYDDRLTEFFDSLLSVVDTGFFEAPQQPDQLFALITDFILTREPLAGDDTLKSLLLWDYYKVMKSTGKTPSWIKEQSTRFETLGVAGSQRVPVLSIRSEACAVLNKRLAEAIEPGDYALWLQIQKPGRPLTVIHVDSSDKAEIA